MEESNDPITSQVPQTHSTHEMEPTSSDDRYTPEARLVERATMPVQKLPSSQQTITQEQLPPRIQSQPRVMREVFFSSNFYERPSSCPQPRTIASPYTNNQSRSDHTERERTGSDASSVASDLSSSFGGNSFSDVFSDADFPAPKDRKRNLKSPCDGRLTPASELSKVLEGAELNAVQFRAPSPRLAVRRVRSASASGPLRRLYSPSATQPRSISPVVFSASQRQEAMVRPTGIQYTRPRRKLSEFDDDDDDDNDR
eukprot:m.195007 g.195007  ORF g.195007 m.195007 type:complete len:256 (-) comp32544_c2_seq4:32-799(-)